MNSPSAVRLRVDAQGRLVLPKGWREQVVDTPGSVLLRRTTDGLLLTRAPGEGTVEVADDGLPILSVGRRVTTAEVKEAIEHDRADR
ncbi:MAG: hypothetical protein ACR2HR_02145 [Euzebya sp.]